MLTPVVFSDFVFSVHEKRESNSYAYIISAVVLISQTEKKNLAWFCWGKQEHFGSNRQSNQNYNKLFLFMKIICEERKLKLGFTSHGWDAKLRKRIYEVVINNIGAENNIS